MTTAEVRETGPRVVPTLHAAVRAVTDAVRGAQVWSAPDRADLIGQVDRAIAVLTAVRAELLVAERDSGAWKLTGDRSYEAWRARTSRSGMRAATAEVRRADTILAMPTMREAAEQGQVSVEHLDVVARAAAIGSGPVRDALASAQGQAAVLGLARRQDAGNFARSVALWAATLDSGALERNHQAQRAARFLHLADTDSGTRISGQLDRMAGHTLRLALEAVSGLPAADDERSPEQRRADALQCLAEKTLALPDTGSGAAVRPHVSFLMSVEAWAALRAGRNDLGMTAVRRSGDRARASTDAVTAPEGAFARLGSGGRGLPRTAPMPPVMHEDGTPVPPTEVARVLCDCELTRIVLDAADEPVNLGRTARTYTGAQRRSVIARDGGCIWTSCDVPARWCEVHHIRWWDRDGGATSVANGALVCSYHHHEIHRLGLAITRHQLGPGERGYGTRRVRYTLALPDGTVLAGNPDGMALAGSSDRTVLAGDLAGTAPGFSPPWPSRAVP